jgi:hypothetical protein
MISRKSPQNTRNAASAVCAYGTPAVVACSSTVESGKPSTVLVYAHLAPSARRIRAALAYARDQGLLVVPRCPFVRTNLLRHPEEAALFDPAYYGPAD